MKNIYVLDNNDDITESLDKMFENDAEVIVTKIPLKEYKKIFKESPDILVIDEDLFNNDEKKSIKMCKEIRDDENSSITPMILISSNRDTNHVIEMMKNEVELYLKKPVNPDILYYSIKNIMKLLNSNRMVSPLTGLPGNIQIQSEMSKRLNSGEEFVMLYIDLDNFKAYNDTYGFSSGDEIIKFTASVIEKYVFKDNVDNFVGHIGGDDFVAIVGMQNYESICQDIITEFDAKVKKYFNKEDIDRGYIEVENRKGIIEQFPITSVSIGAVEVNRQKFNNTLEIGEAGAEVKHLAKTIYGSSYVIDRRKKPNKKHS